MNKEELIEALRQFDEKRVEELPEKTRNIFYSIMKIADERDEYIHLYESTLKDLDIAVKNKIELENIRKEAIEYLTSYESISTIQGLNDIEKNKILDEKTMNEMVNRYLKVHDILLNILNKGDNNGRK